MLALLARNFSEHLWLRLEEPALEGMRRIVRGKLWRIGPAEVESRWIDRAS